MTPNKQRHWTSGSPKDFQFAVASNFIVQIENRLVALGWSQNKFAKKLGVSDSRVSQILCHPGDMRISTMANWAKTVGLKLCIVALEDGDPKHTKGPVNSEIVRKCWERLGKPGTVRELDDHDNIPFG